MYLADAVKVLIRRWYIVPAGILLMVGAVIAASKIVATEYQASGEVLLPLPSDATGSETPTNPFLNLQSGLSVTASLIAGSLTTPDAVRELSNAGFAADYTVVPNPAIGPMLVITVQSVDPQMASATRDELVKQVNLELERTQTQEKVPSNQIIHSRESAMSAQASVLSGSKVRAFAAIVAAGSVLTLMVAFALDRVLASGDSTSRRRLRREGDKGAIQPTLATRNLDETTPRTSAPRTTNDDELSAERPKRRSSTRLGLSQNTASRSEPESHAGDHRRGNLNPRSRER